MSLRLLGEYGSDSSEGEESPQTTPSNTNPPPSRTPPETADSANPPSEQVTQYDPFGISTPLDDVNTSSSESESDKSEEIATPPEQDGTLPLPDLEAPLSGAHKKSGSSVFSNPYKDAEEERLSVLKHHVKEFAPEVREDKRRQRRQRGRRGRQSQTLPPGTLFDDNDSSASGEGRLGRRKVRSGVGDSLLPPKKFMKAHSQLQAQEKPWTR